MLDEDEEDLQRALALSRQDIDMEDEEADLRRAIQLSMQGTDSPVHAPLVAEGVRLSSVPLEVNALLVEVL